MTLLIDLPLELLQMMFHHLGSIDDVHHFGRTCTKTAGIIQRRTAYTEIMRSIILREPQHRYDVQLCWIQRLHSKIVGEMQNNTSQLPATQDSASGYEFNKWEKNLLCVATAPDCEHGSCDECLSDSKVYDILARYQGLRVLEDLWLKRQLAKGDFISAECTSDPEVFTDAYKHLICRQQSFKDCELPSRSRLEAIDYTSLNADMRARFHAAVTCVWFLNEVRWVLTNFAYPVRFDVQIRLLELVKAQIVAVRHKTLLDELDQHAMFKFMYHHLLPLYGHELADNKVSRLPLTFSLDFTKDVAHCSRLLQLFLTVGQTYLQPPDIIDLAARVQLSRKYPYPVVAFPTTTVQWQRPSNRFSFPATASIDLCDQRYKRLIARTTLTHLNLIARSSFHQTAHDTSAPWSTIHAPMEAHMYELKDLAHYHFLDRAMMAFELYENKGAHLRDIREVFERKWGDELWSVWWWANGEDKARAKMERWRREPMPGRAQRRVI